MSHVDAPVLTSKSETLTYDFMAKAWRAIELVSNQLPRAPCKVGDNEGQVERQASAAI
jgi:hypothetical protein